MSVCKSLDLTCFFAQSRVLPVVEFLPYSPANQLSRSSSNLCTTVRLSEHHVKTCNITVGMMHMPKRSQTFSLPSQSWFRPNGDGWSEGMVKSKAEKPSHMWSKHQKMNTGETQKLKKAAIPNTVTASTTSTVTCTMVQSASVPSVHKQTAYQAPMSYQGSV